VDIMAAPQGGGQRRRKRHLTPQEKYQVWQEVVAGQGSQREIADRWGIDRSTVVHIVKTAKESALNGLAASRPGRPGKSAAELALEDAQAEIERLKETVTEQAVELHLFRGKGRWD
jgi:transposase-like protein